MNTGNAEFNVDVEDCDTYKPDGSIVAEYQQIIEFWKLAVEDQSFLKIDNGRYNELNPQTGLRKKEQSWGCAVTERPQNLCLDVGSARTFGQSKTIVGWRAITDNQNGELSNCNISLADGSGFTADGTACAYSANGDVTQSQFFQQLVIDVSDQEHLLKLYQNWLSTGLGDDPRFGGYICGEQFDGDHVQGKERFNDGILDVFDMTLLAYVMFNIQPYEDIHRKIIDKIPVNASYMSQSIETEFMSQFSYNPNGDGVCTHNPAGQHPTGNKDDGLQFFAHFTDLNSNGHACPRGSDGRARLDGSSGGDRRQLQDQVNDNEFSLSSFVLYQWSRVMSTPKHEGGTWYKIAFAPGIIPLVIQFYIDGMDAGHLPSQVTADPAPDENEQMYPLNSNRVNVRWVSRERTDPEPNEKLCYDIAAAVQSNYVIYKNALAIRQIGLSSRRPCPFDLYLWIPEQMHTDVILRQPEDRRRLESEPCLKSIMDERTGNCEAVVHIRPGSQFSTPSGYFALAEEMSAKLPPKPAVLAAGISMPTASEDEQIQSTTSDNWWVWVVVALSIVLVLVVAGIVCGAIAYKRHEANQKKNKGVQIKSSDPKATKVTAKTAPKTASKTATSSTKNVAAADRARTAKKSRANLHP